ncbi:MAG: ferritin-like domain-containing protein [Deltaproteobacteria bacterium]|nr:ferritin-like domain-containing protein [Deltaproteobacteria bacterium]
MDGFFLEGFTATISMVEDEAALKAMQGNERITNRSYQASLEEAWPDDLRQLTARNYGDEQRHLAYIREALRNRAWEEQGPVQHA